MPEAEASPQAVHFNLRLTAEWYLRPSLTSAGGQQAFPLWGGTKPGPLTALGGVRTDRQHAPHAPHHGFPDSPHPAAYL